MFLEFNFIFDFLLILTIIGPYLMYTYAYKLPKHFKKFWTQDQLVNYSVSVKSLCFFLYFILCISSGFNFSSIPFSIFLISIGQYLNYLVYQKLGKVRAYYGWELGLDKSSPLKGFPFTLGHAQYKGCLLSLLGFYLTFNPTLKLTIMTSIWAFMYFYMIILESTEPGKL